MGCKLSGSLGWDYAGKGVTKGVNCLLYRGMKAGEAKYLQDSNEPLFTDDTAPVAGSVKKINSLVFEFQRI